MLIPRSKRHFPPQVLGKETVGRGSLCPSGRLRGRASPRELSPCLRCQCVRRHCGGSPCLEEQARGSSRRGRAVHSRQTCLLKCYKRFHSREQPGTTPPPAASPPTVPVRTAEDRAVGLDHGGIIGDLCVCSGPRPIRHSLLHLVTHLQSELAGAGSASWLPLPWSSVKCKLKFGAIC